MLIWPCFLLVVQHPHRSSMTSMGQQPTVYNSFLEIRRDGQRGCLFMSSHSPSVTHLLGEYNPHLGSLPLLNLACILDNDQNTKTEQNSTCNLKKTKQDGPSCHELALWTQQMIHVTCNLFIKYHFTFGPHPCLTLFTQS